MKRLSVAVVGTLKSIAFKGPTFGMIRRLWRCSGEPVRIYERQLTSGPSLGDRPGRGEWVIGVTRGASCDRDGSCKDCEILKKLISEPVNTVRLYAPAGEVSAAFAILDFFNIQL